MKKTYFVASLIIVGLFLWYLNSAPSTRVGNDLGNPVVTVFKTQACGCCANYVSYLKSQGFNVQVKDMQDITGIKQQYGVPSSMQSCHTTVMGNYVVEGHIPAEAIQKMMVEKPSIKGIAMPGMPSASPGMPGAKSAPFKIYSIQNDGSAKEYMTI